MANEVKCWCRHCKKELPPSHTGPCPHCGKLGKNIIATITDYVSITASFNAQKIHKYTQKHPWFISISVAFTITSLIVGYLVGGLVGLLIGIIVAMLNWWVTPYAMKTIVEITHLGNKERETQEETKNDTQKSEYSNKDIYRRLGDIEKKLDSSSQTQKFVALYALGVAIIILGLSYWPLLLEHTGVATTIFYRINISGLLAMGTAMLVYVSLRSKKGKEKGEKKVGSKGKKNVKKPKQTGGVMR